ncbi:MAG: aminopeptidase P family protein [Bacteroidetes bacterium]|nr:aminopeptidase P family protein [Bacteroidota bacterium]
MTERKKRLDLFGKSKGLNGFLLTSPSNILSYSGYWYDFQTGASPFQLLPAVLFISADQGASLLLADNEESKSVSVHEGITIKLYSSYSYREPLMFRESFLSELTDGFETMKIKTGRIGIEGDHIPNVVIQKLSEVFPSIEWINVDQDIAVLRAIKDEDEIESIKLAANLADIGQEAVLKYAAPGMTELELFSKVRLEMETAAGARIPLMADLISGAATATGGGNPRTKKMEKNDFVLSDFTPCLNGYWGDSCNTIVLGQPSSGQQEIFESVKDALDIGVKALVPGNEAREVDRLMRGRLDMYEEFGHHGGHGVGTCYHEEPRIVPYNKMILEPGMVIALEPAVYKEKFGIRVEHLAVVRTGGPQILTKFNHRFSQ